jgi:predicted aspartyl protease
MAYISGSTGKVKIGTTEYPVTNWSLKLSSNVASFADSTSSGWKVAVSGSKEASGEFSGKVPASAAIPAPGQSGAFTLALDDGHSYHGNGIINEVSIETNVDTGEAIGYKASFIGDGAWSSGT